MSQQLQITGGAKVRNLQDVIVGNSGVLDSLGFNIPNGVPKLDNNGKILVSQLPNSVMEYKGTWNVTTNTPYLVNGTGDQGDVYLVEGAATGGTSHNFGAGAITFYNGDQVIYSGTIWQRASGSTGTVTSVAVTESSAALNITGSPITTSGTINIGFAGTSAQYVAGDGSLITFPSLSGYVPYTGATADVNLGTKNIFTNNLFEGFTSVTASGTQIVLTIASTPVYLVTGSGGQTIKLPDATTLPAGAVFSFNNNQSSGAITVNNNSNTLVASIPSGGYCNLELIDNSIAAGSWDRHFQAPSNVSWSTNTFDYPGSITSATWNGNIIAINRGGTGASTASTALANLGGVPTTRTLTINGTTYDLSADRSWTITTGISSISGTAPISVATVSGVSTVSISQSTTSTNGYLSSTDWNTFNNKQNALGYTPADDTLVVHLAGTETITGAKTFNANAYFNSNIYTKYTTAWGALSGYVTFAPQSLGGGFNAFNYQDGNNNTTFKLIYNNTINSSFTFQSVSSGVIALLSDIPSLAGYVPTSRTLTINGVTYDLSADRNWTISGGISSVVGNAPIGVSTTSGVATVSISQATTSSNGFLSSTDWNTFNGKQSALSFSGPLVNSGGTIYIYTATSTQNGYLTSTDWNTFNNKVPASRTLTINGTTYDLSADRSWTISAGIGGSGTANYHAKFTASGTIGNSGIYEGTSGYVSIGNTNSTYNLDVTGTGRFTGNLFTGSQIAMGGESVIYGGLSGLYALQNGNASFYSYAQEAGIVGNGYYSSGWLYKTTAAATRYLGSSGSHNFQYAASGTAGTALTWLNAMVITSAGNVGIGTSSPSTLLQTNQTGTTGYFYSGQQSGTEIAYWYYNASEVQFSSKASSRALTFLTTDTERMRITSGGNVGIGTVGASNTRLTVAGVDASTSNYSIVVNNNTISLFYVRNDGVSTFVNLAGTGSRAVLADASGNLSAPISDISVKENISSIGYGLNEILKMNPVWFDFIDEYKNYGEGRQNGNIAQEMEAIIPEAVFVTPSTGKMGINYDQLHAVYIKAIQELNDRLNKLENK